MANLISRRTDLSSHLVQFCRWLRTKQFDCGITEEKNALQALSVHIPRNNSDFLLLLKSILAKNKNQFLRFDELFQIYWTQLERAEDSKVMDKEDESEKAKPKPGTPSLYELKDWLFNGRATESQGIAQASPVEVFAQKDFSQFKTMEIESLLEIVKKLSKKLAQKEFRRYQKTNKRKWIDLRRTFHQNIRKGRAVEEFYFRQRKKKKLKVTVFCDVSKSMDLYTRFFLQFLYSFHQVSAKIETFVFSTSLSHISPMLNQFEFDNCLDQLSDAVNHWSGGTNIGQSLASFQEGYGKKYIDKKTTILILSDGCDVGDANELKRQMQFLSNKSHRLIWVNPLAGNKTYAPETEGMRTALPFIDVFTSAHNLESLLALVAHLRK